jgi:hypothetical protein
VAHHAIENTRGLPNCATTSHGYEAAGLIPGIGIAAAANREDWAKNRLPPLIRPSDYSLPGHLIVYSDPLGWTCRPGRRGRQNRSHGVSGKRLRKRINLRKSHRTNRHTEANCNGLPTLRATVADHEPQVCRRVQHSRIPVEQRLVANPAQRPAQPAKQTPIPEPVELGAQLGRLAGGDSLCRHGVGKRGLELPATFLLLLEQPLGAVDPAALPLELRSERIDGAFQRLNYPGTRGLSGAGYQG